MVMNAYLVRMFSNSMVSFTMAERAWIMIQEWGAPEPVEHRDTSQKYALLWEMIDIQQSECWPNGFTLIQKPFVKLSGKIREEKLCVWFIPYALTSEQREDRITPCRNFLQMHESDQEFFNESITGLLWCKSQTVFRSGLSRFLKLRSGTAHWWPYGEGQYVYVSIKKDHIVDTSFCCMAVWRLERRKTHFLGFIIFSMSVFLTIL